MNVRTTYVRTSVRPFMYANVTSTRNHITGSSLELIQEAILHLTDRAQKPLDMRTRITLVLPPFHFQNGGRQIKIHHVIVEAVTPLAFLWENLQKDDLNLPSFNDAAEPSGKRSDQNQFA